MTVIPLLDDPDEARAWGDVLARAARNRRPQRRRYAPVPPTRALDGVKRCDGCGTWVADVDRCEACR